MAVTLRTLADRDLDALFEWESDPRAVQMAAFTRADPSDRSAFDAHYERIRNDPSATLRAIDDDGEFVGTVGSFTMEGEREVTYWIAPARWGQGVATRSLRQFLAIEQTRPLYGRVAEHNAASAKVLPRGLRRDRHRHLVRARSRRRGRRADLPPRSLDDSVR